MEREVVVVFSARAFNCEFANCTEDVRSAFNGNFPLETSHLPSASSRPFLGYDGFCQNQGRGCNGYK